MPLFEPVFPQRYFAPMLKALESAPAPLRRACENAAGLREGSALQPNLPISFDRFEAMLEVILAEPGFADFGFSAGLRMRVLDHGPLVPALVRCRTLEERLRLQARYYRLITPVLSLHYTRHADRGEFVCRPTAPIKPIGLRTLFEMYAIAGYANFPDHLLDPMAPCHVYLPMEEPAYVARYQALKAVRFHFVRTGLPELRFVFPDTMLTKPLQDVRMDAPSDGAQPLGELLQRVNRSPRVSEWARLLLLEAEACQPTADELAGLLSVSRKTFERALAAEGVHYRELTKEVRHQRACEYLRNPDIAIGHIAYRLGYSDIASFSHAFRSMAGCSPSEHRKRL